MIEENHIVSEVLDAPLPTGETLAANLARSITDEVVAQLPDEKRAAEAAMVRTAKELAERGSDYADGRGQAIGSIPPRVYMRWAALLPGCWQDRTFVEEFLVDNPQCRAPGWRPSKRHGLRHGFTIGASFYHKNKETVTA